MAKEDNVISEEQYNQMVFEDGGNLVVNLTDVEEAKFELVPKGIYDANIDSWELTKSESSGYMMFAAVFQLEHPDYEKVKLRSYFSFSPKALPYTKRSLNQFARDVFGGGPFNAQEIADSGVMIGRKVRLRVTHRDYESQKQANVADVLPPAGNGASGGASNGGGKSGGKFF
jgi:hypothetical protein